MINSKTFYQGYMGEDEIGRQIATFCNENKISKRDIIACQIYFCQGIDANKAVLIWEEVEVE
jgi:hypothetical protein